MSFAPIAYTIPQYENYPNYWMKSYLTGTTTPKAMAIDTSGSPLVAKFELNAEGFPITAGSAKIIPHIDGAYDLWLFPTEAEADANDTSLAIKLATNINASSTGSSSSAITPITIQLNAAQTIVTTSVEASTGVFHVSENASNGLAKRLTLNVDYTITTSTEIALTNSYPQGTYFIQEGLAAASTPFEAQTTTTELIASDRSPVTNDIVETSGYTTFGDGGGAQWRHNGITGQTASQSPAQLNAALLNDANGNQWAYVYKDAFYALAFGGIDDNVTSSVDNSDVLQALMTAAQSLDTAVVDFNNRVFRKKDDGQSLSMSSGSFIIFQNGTLIHEDTDTNARNDLLTFDDLDRLEFRDFSIDGTLQTYLSQTNQSQTLTCRGIADLRLLNVSISNVRYMATSCNNCSDVLVQGGSLSNVLRDGWRFTGSKNVRIMNTSIFNVADDCVALHTVETLDIIQGNYLISGNTIRNSQGIKLLGAKFSRIENNTFQLMTRRAIRIQSASGTTEGDTSLLSISIKNNTIMDVFSDRGSNDIISIDNEETMLGGLTTLPGLEAEPYDYFYNRLDSGDPTSVHVGSYHVEISDNQILRTLKEGDTVTDQGFPAILDRSPSVAYYDPTITYNMLHCHGVNVVGPLWDAKINNNIIQAGCISPVRILGIDGEFWANDIEISGNYFRDYSVGCDLDGFGNTTNIDITIDDNTFDPDPYFRSANRNADGSWTTEASLSAILLPSTGTITGLIRFTSNKIKNASTVSVDIDLNDNIFSKNNEIYCEPVALGFSTSNKGVGTVITAKNNMYLYYVRDSDPASSTYRELITKPVDVSTAQPAAGTYVVGAFVSSLDSSKYGVAPNDYLVDGWERLTTGSAHVAGTDWVERRNYFNI